MTDWFTADDVRNAVGAVQAVDQARSTWPPRWPAASARGVRPGVPGGDHHRARPVRVPCGEVPLRYRPATLTSVALYRSGSALTVGDFDFDGQVLFRRDGGAIVEDLQAVYTAGYSTTDAIPGEIRAYAELVAAQYIRVVRRFLLRGEDPTQVSFPGPGRGVGGRLGVPAGTGRHVMAGVSIWPDVVDALILLSKARLADDVLVIDGDGPESDDVGDFLFVGLGDPRRDDSDAGTFDQSLAAVDRGRTPGPAPCSASRSPTTDRAT